MLVSVSLRRVLPLAVGGAVALGPGYADAVKCDSPISETFALTLMEITRDGEPADDPLRLGEIDELINSGSGGVGILLWAGVGVEEHLATRYELSTAITPTDGARRHIDESNARKSRGVLCGGIPYRAIQPGVYTFTETQGSGSDDPSPLENPVVTIAADRRPVTLDFDFDGSSWTAVYAVDEAFFEADEGCGCTTDAPSNGPAALFVVLGLLGIRRRRL